jgi:hypothetical protein
LFDGETVVSDILIASLPPDIELAKSLLNELQNRATRLP